LFSIEPLLQTTVLAILEIEKGKKNRYTGPHFYYWKKGVLYRIVRYSYLGSTWCTQSTGRMLKQMTFKYSILCVKINKFNTVQEWRWIYYTGAGVNWPPRSSARENSEFFYLPWMKKILNFEFIFAIRGPKISRRGVHDNVFKHKIGGLLFTCTPRMIWGGRARGEIHPNPTQAGPSICSTHDSEIRLPWKLGCFTEKSCLMTHCLSTWRRMCLYDSLIFDENYFTLIQ